MHVNSKTVVYVGCPSFYKTGGTELAHQFVNVIKRLGIRSQIFYYDTKVSNDLTKINPAFQKYVKTYAIKSEILDDANNILIMPEININLLKEFVNIQKCIWWMSVDNFVKRDGIKNAIKYYGYCTAIKSAITGKIPFRKIKLDNSIVNLYQSEYARLFLIDKGLNNIHRLSDYLNDTYLDISNLNFDNRSDYILYNPKKGLKFTQKLIHSTPDMNWIPIQNMSTKKVRELLLKSKVYVDFGNHPGKDRFPREAAISGCCIITGTRGSAANNVDIPIPNKFKFYDNDNNIKLISNTINKCLYDYKKEVKLFDNYRNMILKEKTTFLEDVKDLFLGTN